LLGVCDVVAWSGQQIAVLNWACGAFAVLGLLVQFLLERRWRRRQSELEKARKQAEESAQRPPPPPPAPRRWWEWGPKKSGHRAA
jgi:hypothetical protein